MDISIVVVSWNTKNFLVECIESIISTTKKYAYEIIVVDNASSDGSPDEIKEHYPQVLLIQNESNLGFAKANNIGIMMKSTGRYVCLINSDVKVLPECLDTICDYLDSKPSIGLLGPTIFNSDRTLQPSCRKLPSLWTTLCSALGLDKMFLRSNFYSGEQMLFFKHDKIIDVGALSGCFLVARRSAIDSVGFLDEDFFMYSEDVDWCKRFHRLKWRVVFYPEAKAIHYGGGSSANARLKFFIERERALLQYWKKHFGCAYARIHLLMRLLHYGIRVLGGSMLWIVIYSKRRMYGSKIIKNFTCLRFLLRYSNPKS